MADRLSPWIRRVLGVSALALLALTLVGTVLWAVPSAIAARHPGFSAAKEQALKDRSARMLLGPNQVADRWPQQFEVEGERACFGFEVRSELGSVWIEAETEGGRVVRLRRHLSGGWQQRWATRQLRNARPKK